MRSSKGPYCGRGWFGRTRALRGLIFAAACAVAACSEDGPYLAVGGGGFVFNYRIAEATAGVVVEPQRTLPDGSTIVFSMENPAGGEPLVESKSVTPDRKRYSFQTEVKGVKADTDYVVTVQLVAADGSTLETIEQTMQSDLDQSIIGDKPLTVGPGYARNPELNTQK